LFAIWVVFHVVVCIALILVVLMQSAKGEGLAGSAFGGGGGGLGGAVFGGRGAASFLSRATTVLAIVFMLNCGALAFMSIQNTGVGSAVAAEESVVTREAQKERDQALQQQQQQQLQGGDSLNPAGDLGVKVLPGEAAGDASTTTPSTDTSGQ